MENINTFQEGMNKDLSKSLLKAGSYIHAENFSLITDVGLSTGTLRNIKGNEWFIDIPSCSNVVRITGVTAGSPISVSITSNLGSFTSGPHIVQNLEALGSLLQADPQFAAYDLAVAYNDIQIVIYATLINNKLTNNNIGITTTNAVSDASYIAKIDTPKIVGWGTIRDEIIIFTADSYEEEPVNKTGQIWNVIYNKATNVPTITLLYNNYLNLSLYHPIPNPGGVVGNFETPEVQKIYWTDNYNKPKVFNVAASNTMALQPDELELSPSIAKSVAVISRILGGGNIKTGIYQVSARLTSTSGSTSLFTIPSNPIQVIEENEGSSVSFDRYEARDPGVDVSKTIEGKLFNLDPKYDRFEPVIIYRGIASDIPTIYILPSQRVPADGVYTFTYTGGETTIPISWEEFLESPIIFNTVKTMASKNNMLFFGNVKYSDFDVDFDARAYRFTNKDILGNSSRVASLTNAAGSVEYKIDGSAPTTSSVSGSTTFTSWNSIPEDADAIQTNEAQAPDALYYHLWQTDGITFGGEGPNVKYEFVPSNIFNDTSVNKTYRVPLDTIGVNSSAPYARVDVANVSIDTNAPFGGTSDYDKVTQYNSYFNASSPYVTYGLKGYQRDETYRFGIVFYSKKGEPSYVHWVGDIRMPKPYMPSVSGGLENRNYLAFPICSMDDGTSNTTNDSTTITGSQRNFYGNNLGIKFTVDVTSIKDQISGYSVVRVARTDIDKTVLGQGIFTPVWTEGNANDYAQYTVPGGEQARWAGHPTPGSYNQPGSVASFLNKCFGLASPEFLFKEHPTFSTGDAIDFIQVNESFHSWNAMHPRGSNSARVQKYYTPWFNASAPRASTVSAQQTTPVPFHESKVVNPGNEISLPISNTLRIRNESWRFDVDSPSNSGWYISDDNNGTKVPRALGGTRLIMGISQNLGRTLDSVAIPFGATDFDSLAFGWDRIRKSTSELIGGVLVYSGFTGVGSENIYIANYKRPTTVQYGGKSFSERSYNEYVSTGHIQVIDKNTSAINTSMVFGGDTYVTLFDYSNELRNSAVFDKNVYNSGGSKQYDADYEATRLNINLVAVECTFPIELRKQNSKPSGAADTGYASTSRCAPNKSTIYDAFPRFITGGNDSAIPYTTLEWSEVFELNTEYFANNDVVKFFPSPDPYVYQTVFDVRVHRSEVKVNGELNDSWTVFKTENYIDVDTSQGELNNLIIYQNTLVGFQDKGVVQLSVKDRAITPDISGTEIILGTGGVLENYMYISKIIGSRHQFSFTTSHDAVFWFDMNTKNVYKMSGAAPVAITVSKGLTSYFNNNLEGLIQVFDNPYMSRGITSTYNFKYNEAIMTFNDSVIDISKSIKVILTTVDIQNGIYSFNLSVSPTWLIPGSDIAVIVGRDSYLGKVGPTGVEILIPSHPQLSAGLKVELHPYTPKSFTVAYNDFIDSFTSFYSFTPSVYINDQISIFSPDSSLNKVFKHEAGKHGVFYVDYINTPNITYTPSKSTLKFIVNVYPTETKVFDNYEMVTEVIDLDSGSDIVDDTFNRIRIYNDYQNTDFQNLPIDNGKDTAKRKERTWNISNLRNRVNYPSVGYPNIFTNLHTSDQPFGERIRDKYMIVDLEYDNLLDRRLILHTFKTHYRKSAR